VELNLIKKFKEKLITIFNKNQVVTNIFNPHNFVCFGD